MRLGYGGERTGLFRMPILSLGGHARLDDRLQGDSHLFPGSGRQMLQSRGNAPDTNLFMVSHHFLRPGQLQTPHATVAPLAMRWTSSARSSRSASCVISLRDTPSSRLMPTSAAVPAEGRRIPSVSPAAAPPPGHPPCPPQAAATTRATTEPWSELFHRACGIHDSHNPEKIVPPTGPATATKAAPWPAH